ncbi:SusC/RagA family TonB-linked outer membrane protein [Pontibacter russatus]|uniref:SusC/RagA family TonB-linked outer membrane protein n=1 Tax=Pontibacter russatus TaxID=2694929 RepID=UPI00137AA65D|nr:SusC/RagA family TonB-linked outer membrane protein [Pontibacter russatus]
MKKRILFLFLTLLCSAVGFAQTKSNVTGTVKDASGTPLPGVSVIESGTGNGVATDATGNFNIAVAPDAVLQVMFLGYATKEVPVNNAAVLNIVLEEDTKRLEEVVVTALGISREKRQLGYSVTELKASDVETQLEANPVNALQGKVAGVQIDQSAGGVFGNSKIQIRGNSTLSTNNQPIFVIDGVILDNDVNGLSGRSFGNDLKNLNMEDFESISILKGSAAAALYGARAINGVVLITTKKGSKQEGLGITVTQSVHVADPFKGPQFQNEFGGGSVGAYFTDFREPNYGSDQNFRTKVFPIDPITGMPYIDPGINRELENWGPRLDGQEVLNYDGTITRYEAQPDNFLEAFDRGVSSNTNVAIQGGTDKSTFRVSYSHDENRGVVPRNEMLKNGFSARATHIFNDIFSIDLSGDYTATEAKNPPNLNSQDAFASGNFGKAYTWIFPRNYDTDYWRQRENYIGAFGGVPRPLDPNEPNKVPGADFWFSLYENDYVQKEQMMRGRIALTAEVTDWMKVVLEGNVNNIYKNNEVRELGQGYNFAGQSNRDGGYYSLAQTSKNTGFLKWMTVFTQTLSEDFDFNGYIGGETQRTQIDFNSIGTSGGLNIPAGYFVTNSRLPNEVAGGITYNKHLNSLYASADFAFRDQVYLQTTWRGDWSSALTYSDGTGNNFYNYPSASLSWVFSETLGLPTAVSFAKLRANVAALGKDTDPYTLNPGFIFNGFATINGQNISLSTFNNSNGIQPNLKPERKLAKELGLEMRFLSDRVGFDVTVYQDNTKNQILPIQVPQESGVRSVIINAGNIQNRGIEFALNATPVLTNNFQWNISGNISHNKNKIISLSEGVKEFKLGGDIFEVGTYAIAGESYGIIRSRIHSKKYQAEDENGNPVDDPNNGKPVLSWRSDARAAFPARSNELQTIGDINAKYRWGLQNNFTLGRLNLGVLIDAKVGGDIILSSYRLGTHTGVLPNTLFGRDAEHGGITWTSAYDGQTYDDGIIVEGVFAPGQMVTLPDGSSVDVGGMTFEEAYEQGFVEPTHAPQYYYRYGSSSTGVSDLMIWENSWVALREVSLSYNFQESIYSKLKLTSLSLSLVGRDLGYLYNSLPFDINPASNLSNSTAVAGEYGFLPMVRNMGFTLRLGI